MMKSSLSRAGAVLALISVVYVAPLAASTTSTATSNVRTPASTKARKLPAPSTVAPAGFLGTTALIGRCTLHAMNRGANRKGVRASIEARLIDPISRATVQSFSGVKGRTRKNGEFSVEYLVLGQPGGPRPVALSATVDIGGGKKVTDVEFTCLLID